MKRLIVCCDGTWQRLDNPYPTNVLKMAQAIRVVDDGGVHQIVFYDEGIGTGGLGDRLGGGAFGWGIDRNIQEAYRFLCMNYAEGDEVYLFGFSRGAYTVRSLAGLIYNAGLLRREHIRRSAEAYELYRSRDPDDRPGGENAVRFRQKYGGSIDIHLLGCWDTVGALGVPEVVPLHGLLNQRYRFYNTELNQRVVRALHAVALDENLEVFEVTPMNPSPHRGPEQVRQVWFPGNHGCVGGGVKSTRGLADAALEWMMREVEALGLALDRAKIEDGIQPDFSISFEDSVLGLLKFTRKRPRSVDGRFGDLHESVKRRWKELEAYYPPNLRQFEGELDGWEP